MNGDKILKTYTPFSIAQKFIIKNLVENGANIFYATVASDRIVSNLGFHNRYFRIADEEKLIQKVYGRYQEILTSRKINLKVFLQIMFFLFLMFARLVFHNPFKKVYKSNLTFTFGLPQINLNMPIKQFHNFLNQKKFTQLSHARLIVVENRKKSPLKDSKFKNIIQTFDIYMYMYKKLPTYQAKLEVLHLSIRRLFLVLTSRKKVYTFIKIEYVIQDPIWITAKSFYDRVDAIATQSNLFKLPIMFFHSQCCTLNTNMFWYSANSIPLSLKASAMTFDTSYLIQSNIKKHFVWNESNASLIKRYNPDCEVEICGSILFYTPTPGKLSRVTSKKIHVIIFDVTPFLNFPTPTLYTDELVTDFLKDIFDLLNQYKKDLDIRILVKNKRDIRNNLFKKSLYPVGRKYSTILAEIEIMPDVFRLQSSVNLYDSVKNCDLVLGLPFTSPVFIGQELGIPSAFYLPEIYTDWKIPQSMSSIKVIKGKKQLQYFFREKFLN